MELHLEARFEFPNGLTIDGAGNIYVADSDQTIRKISPAGMVSTLLEYLAKSGHVDGGGQIAQFNSNYSSLASDAAGNVYLADSDNHSIRKITPAGQVTTVAGFQHVVSDLTCQPIHALTIAASVSIVTLA